LRRRTCPEGQQLKLVKIFFRLWQFQNKLIKINDIPSRQCGIIV
jgi:hypothetical protein